MNTILAIGAGGAVGSVARYLMTLGIQRVAGPGFPVGTIAVNDLGSFAIGLLYVWLVERDANPALRARSSPASSGSPSPGKNSKRS